MGLTNNAISALSQLIIWFIYTYLGLDWLGILLVFTVLLFQSLWNHIIIIIMLQIMLLSLRLMHYIYLQHPSILYPWDVECLLSLLENWAQASSLTNLNFLGRLLLLALVTVQNCSDLTLLHIDNAHFSFSIMLLFLILSKMD